MQCAFNYQGGKGGVSVSLTIAGVNMCFVNCHLAAHPQFFTDRLQVGEQERKIKFKIVNFDFVHALQCLVLHKAERSHKIEYSLAY